MVEDKFVVTYDALAADFIDAGSDRPTSLVVVAGRQRLIIRMERRAVAQLRARMDIILRRPPAVSQ
jgi:hypothetical protein